MSDVAFDFSLDSLNLTDDVELNYNPDEYQDQVNPAPPAKGNYVSQVLGFKPKTNKEGEAVLVDGRFPVFQLGMVEILDGLGEGVTRKVGLFQDVTTKPFDRYGTVVSQFSDFARSLGTPGFSSLDDGLSLIREALESSTTFVSQFDWNVYDGDFIKAAQEQLGIPTNRDERTDEQKALLNTIYKVGRVTGQQYFPFDPDKDTFTHVLNRGNITFVNPVTKSPVTVEVESRALEARAIISRYYPKGDYVNGKVKVGAVKVKPAQFKLVIG
jgi:hypothetical protein